MKKLLTFSILLVCCAAALAQPTNSTPVLPGVPADAVSWINLLIAGLTPIVIAGIKWLIPKIPSVALPFMAPVVGVILTQLQAFVAGHPSNLVIGAVAGAIGLWIREAVDQSKQKLAGSTDSSTPPAG